MAKWKRLVWGIIVVVVILGVGMGVVKSQRNRMPLVKPIAVAKGNLVKTVSSTGTVRAESYVQVGSKIAGKITQLFVKEDSPVAKGQVIARLDSYDQALRDYERLKSLWEKGFVPAQQVELAREQLQASEIIAPLSGLTTEKFMEQGETAVPGTPIVAIANPQSLLVETNVDETDIGSVKLGQRAQVVLDAMPGDTLTGKVKHIALESRDLKERGITYRVKISFDVPPKDLRIGMTGDVEIVVDRRNGVLKVPMGSIQEEEGKHYVFVLDRNRVRKLEIKTGLANYDEAELVSGPKEGDKVVLGGPAKLKDRQRVRVGK